MYGCFIYCTLFWDSVVDKALNNIGIALCGVPCEATKPLFNLPPTTSSSLTGKWDKQVYSLDPRHLIFS